MAVLQHQLGNWFASDAGFEDETERAHAWQLQWTRRQTLSTVTQNPATREQTEGVSDQGLSLCMFNKRRYSTNTRRGGGARQSLEVAPGLGRNHPPHTNEGREPRQRGRHCLATPEALARRGHDAPGPEVAEGYLTSVGQEAPTRRANTDRPFGVVEGYSSAPAYC